MPEKKKNLQIENPELAEEWHSTKNGKLTPIDVAANSHKKVWWLCKQGHEWEAQIRSRNQGSGCPYCANQLVGEDNCLETINPQLAKEWHPTKNGNLTPKDIVTNSSKKVWWICKQGHEWKAQVDSRNRGNGCPYCANKMACNDNNLQTLAPVLAKEWHSTKNGDLLPENVVINSGKKVWWLCDKEHEWQATVHNRNGKKTGCPYCAGKAVCEDNCLQTINPKLSEEWHPIMNKGLTPKDVTPKSGKKVWWICSKKHEWQARISSRSEGNGCPYCAGQIVTEENCLQNCNPELAKEWHPNKNGNLIPENVTANTHKKVWWICSKGHEWQARIYSRNAGTGCPYCHSQSSKLELRIYTEIKYLFDTVELRKKVDGFECDIFIAKLNVAIEVDGEYWHRNRQKADQKKWNHFQNKGITFLRLREKGLTAPNENDISFSSKDDEFSLLSKMLKRIVEIKEVQEDIKQKIYHYLLNSKLCNDSEYKQLLIILPSPLPGFSLEECNVKLAREWHPTKNGNLTPRDVFSSDSKKMWWLCDKGHEWQARVNNRSSKNSCCPYCTGRKVCGDNSLQILNPNLAKEWHPTKNGNLTSNDVTTGSDKKVWWICDKGHEWQTSICNRNRNNGTKCPYCAGQKVSFDNCLQTLKPELAKEWHPSKNGVLTPKDVTPGSNKKVWWICEKKHEWQATISNRNLRRRCPYCFGKVAHEENCLQKSHPELAKEWHPIKNGDRTPENVTKWSKKKVWWLCKKNHEWENSVANRTRTPNNQCPYCSGKRVYRK